MGFFSSVQFGFQNFILLSSKAPELHSLKMCVAEFTVHSVPGSVLGITDQWTGLAKPFAFEMLSEANVTV